MTRQPSASKSALDAQIGTSAVTDGDSLERRSRLPLRSRELTTARRMPTIPSQQDSIRFATGAKEKQEDDGEESSLRRRLLG
jgi:hypothetical protein